jgi:hypothetical protein
MRIVKPVVIARPRGRVASPRILAQRARIDQSFRRRIPRTIVMETPRAAFPRSLPHLATALVSVAAALAGAGLPCNLGLIMAAPAALAAGAATEIRVERRRARAEWRA